MRTYNYKVTNTKSHEVSFQPVKKGIGFSRRVTIKGFPYSDFYFIITSRKRALIQVEIDLQQTPVYGVCNGNYDYGLNTYYLDEEEAKIAYEAYLMYYTKLALANGWKINEEVKTPTDRYFKVTSEGERIVLYSLTKWDSENCLWSWDKNHPELV